MSADTTCSWKQNWCWPGTCEGYLAKNCACDDGFSLSSRGSTKICDLNISPTLLTCRLGVESNAGEVKNSTSTGSCLEEKSNFMNFQPEHSSFVFEFALNVHVSAPKPDRIYDYSFGIVKASVSVSRMNIHRTRTQLRVLEPHQFNRCTFNGFRNTNPYGSVISCKMNFETPWHFEDGERFCLEFTSYVGGYLRTKDFSGTISQYHIYNSTEASHEVCMMYDSSPPKHCSENSTCLHNETLIIEDRITKSRNLRISVAGWHDSHPWPLTANEASGVDSYFLTIHEILEIDSLTLTMDERSLLSYKLTRDINVIQLPDRQPALYGLSLKVGDKAGNFKLARRFVLFDISSKIKTNRVCKVTVSSGNPATNFTWQINHGEICINWSGRYYNSFNVHFNILRKIKPDFYKLYSGVYEQLEGQLPVSGTPNVNGIIEFLYVIKRNKEMLLNNSVSNIFNQSFCHLLESKDGEVYDITLTAVDIIGNRLSESLVVRMDSSGPEIHFIKDGSHQSSENVTNNPKLTFEILDEHSGLYSVNWTLGTSVGSADLGAGNLPVVPQSQNSCDRLSLCYCPETGNCEKYSYTVNAFEHRFKNSDETHKTSYFLTINAMNHALLLSSLSMEIKVDKCLTNICLNGGICFVVNSSNECSCPNTHHGSRCQNACIRPKHCEEYECTSAEDYVCKKCYGEGATPEKSAYFISTDKKSYTDLIPPQFVNCPSDKIQKYDSGEGSYVTWEPIHAVDNAGNLSLSSNIKNGDFLIFGSHRVIYNATDDSGNINTCNFEVKVTKIK
ncbi:uncharacterized protein LOC134255066, partial [Saccostrea cucullata]|uniref:uncharacterized protein LOC134255066 n=1 Tax=Saccostrea cuccullata TaxID=36930 RepID=UPI002ED2E970